MDPKCIRSSQETESLAFTRRRGKRALFKAEDIGNATGRKLDGVLQDHGVVAESGLVKIPESLDLQQGSTLAIAATAAWDSVFGLPSKRLEAGQWVLTQASGGVSVFAIQVSVYKLQAKKHPT